MCSFSQLGVKMVSLCKQIYMLQWKNVKLKQRRPISTLLELFAPLLLLVILIGIRQSKDFFQKSPTCQFKPSALASKGILAAMRSFCYLGVCRQGNQTFYEEEGLLGEAEYRNISKSLKLANSFLANPAVKRLAGTVVTLPTSQSDPKQTKLIRLSSLFSDNGSKLFEGVSATDTQKAAIQSAEISFPRRWNILVAPRQRLLLAPLLASSDGLPTLLCSAPESLRSGGTSADWTSTMQKLCEQPRFRDNLKSQFNLGAALAQMSSTEANKQTIDLKDDDVDSLQQLLIQLSVMSSDGTFDVFSDLRELGRSLTRGMSGGIPGLLKSLKVLGRKLCGGGQTVLSDLVDDDSMLQRVAEEIKPEDLTEKEENSTLEAVNLTTIVPPEKFCNDRRYQNAILGIPDWLLARGGLFGIKRLMFGEIPFYPETPRTREFLVKLNRTLIGMSWMSYLAENITQVVIPGIVNFMGNSSEMNAIRTLLTTCEMLFAGQSRGQSCKTLLKFLTLDPQSTLSNASGTWRDILNTTDSLMRTLYFGTACFRLNKLRGFDNEKSLENYTGFLTDHFGVNKTVDKPLFVASLLFDKLAPSFVKYRLRFNEDAVDSTMYFKVLDEQFKALPRKNFLSDFKYFTSFFLHIQELLEHGIQVAVTGVDAPLQTYLTMFPSVCYMDDSFATVINFFLPMIMTLSWISNVALLVNDIVYERETRLKEMMKIMGLSDGVHWVSWFITSFVIMFTASVLTALLLKTGQILAYSNPLLVLLFLVSFALSTICEAFFISIFFSNSSVASAFAAVIYNVGFVIYSVVAQFTSTMSRLHFVLSFLIPQVAFGVGCKIIGSWELSVIGLQGKHIFSAPIWSEELTFGLVILMLWVDSAILMLLTWYLEKVFPGAYGVPKPWYFPFLSSFWCGRSDRCNGVTITETVGQNRSMINSNSDQVAVGLEADEISHHHFEDEPMQLKVGVAIRNLTKIYQTGRCPCRRNAEPLIAVDNLSYNFYEDQITSFLGHNGAGKSTTMSILTGLYTPTSGTAFIAGHDIRTDMDEIRKHLGLCPQHNVLFDSLTVEDHIYFYGMLKGLSKSEVAPQIDSFIADVGLQKKRHEISKKLSGGMKRKLSVAMAFVGGSKVIVLDEPTAGVDPHARRAIWDVLAKFRQGRTIILTTHHMDEADILGDRICIINKGRLVCSGSPMFLKKVFGEGYTLTLVKSSAECGVNNVLNMVCSKVPEASLGECTSSEINLKLPYSSVPKLASLFANLDNNLFNLGVSSYGIEDSSLEEIFLAVTGFSGQEREDLLCNSSVVEFRPSLRESVRRRHLEQAMTNNSEGSKCSNTPEPRGESMSAESQSNKQPGRTHCPLWQQVKALWLKRFHVLRRSKIGFLAEFVLPAFFILLALALLQIVPRDGDSPAMELAPGYMLGNSERSRLKDLSVFQSSSLTAFPSNASLTNLSNRLMLHMSDTDFLGTRCMRQDVFSNPDFPCKTQRRGSVWSQTPSNLPSNTSWCQCSYKDYPNSAKCVDWPTPARKSLMSSDILESLQGYNLTNYIQSTVMQYFRKRFGGYTFFVNDTQPVSEEAANANAETQDLLRNLNRLNGGSPSKRNLDELLAYLESARQTEDLKSIVNQVWYDNRGYVSGPAYLNTLSNAIMRALANQSVGSPDQIGVSGWTHPITSRSTYAKNILSKNVALSATIVVFIIFALSFIPASFVLFLISERTTNAKHLQFVSGINPTLYWIVNHTWNLLNYMVSLTIVIFLFVAFSNYEFVGAATIGPFLLTLILFGFASAPLMYPFSWVMSVPSKAFTMLSCLNLGVGLISTMSVTIVGLIGQQSNDQELLNVAEILKNVFLVLPHFCLGQSLMELNIFYQVSVKLEELTKETGIKGSVFKKIFPGVETYENAWNATGRYLGCLAAHSVVYFVLVLLLEYNCCCKQGLVSSRFFRLFYRAEYERSLRQPDATEVDDDVRAEADKVEGVGSDDQLLQLRRLVKIFNTSSGPKAAVKGISLAVKSHECFGFLGVNGAGKTTTFKMLTGDLTPTSGDARVGGFSILTEALEVHKQLGYCPQFDAVLPLLTGRETLQLYARIRGVEEQDIDQLVETISKRVGIEAHLDKIIQEYSGGNKRKLSCGIAFIGNPPIVFLDEPTAGMDPGARRFLWRCIQRMVTAGSCVILTTHSMEDCQALCHRLTIMVNGRLQCIGSPQHLKTKFGQGFTIFLRVRQTQSAASASAGAADAEGQLERAHGAFMSAFPEAVLCENHAAVLQYQLKQTVQLRAIFESVQRLKDSGLVLDYSVNQTTLDQVFINFAKDQSEAAA